MAGSLLSFKTDQYERRETSSFILEPVRNEDGSVKDFRILYASDIFARDWLAIYHNEDYLGACLREATLMDEYSLEMIERFLTEEPRPFVSYMPMVNLHLYFEPIPGLPAPYVGYYMTNFTNHTFRDAKDHFLKNIRQMKNNAILFQRHEDGRIEPVFVSEEFAGMMECSVSEAKAMMTGLGFYKTTVPDDRPLVRSMMERRVAFDGSNLLTIQKITAKHNKVWCNVHYAFIDDFDEHYIYCTYMDVTALKEHEERLRSIYSGLGNNFYQINDKTLANFRVNLTRNVVEEVKGADLFDTDSLNYSYSDIIRFRAPHFPISSEQTQFLQLFDKEKLCAYYTAGRYQLSMILYSIRKNGRSCFVNLSASMTRHPLNGDIVAFITEQECNSEKVKDTLTDKILAEQFDMVAYLRDGQYGITIGEADKIKSGSIFPTTKHGDYNIYLDNQIFPVLSGSEEQKAQTRKALDLETVAEKLKIKEPYVVDVAIEMEGETYYKQFDFYSINPEAKFYILLKSDTTSIQKQHREINEQLQMALEAANHANEAKTSFLSSMSHEIRTPMNAIIGLDNIALKDPDLPERTREHLEKIGSSARHLLKLINDVLDMSRIESGRLTIKNEKFSFSEILEQINTMIYAQCQERGLTYESRIIGGVDDCYIGDDMKLKQVLINILGNAVKFTPAPGTVSFIVERTVQYEGQSSLRFIIKDTGIGMDEEYLPRIFEAFSQEDEYKANKYGSTGLGMSITKNIVELMNGNISVESKKGVGTTFTVNVTFRNCEPVIQAQSVSGNDADDQPDTKEEQTQADLTGRRILMAEDMLINAEILTELLTMMNMKTEHAENGRIAVDMFAKSTAGYYDAVLMDVRMPVLDGLSATKAIRELDRPDAKTIPIIAMTANAFDEDIQRSLQAGMNAHLSKPVEIDRLCATLGKLIKD